MPNTCSDCADGQGGIVDLERARTLLAAERREIEQALNHRGHEDDGDDAGWLELGNLAADLYLDELDEGLAEDLRGRLAALDRAEQRLAPALWPLGREWQADPGRASRGFPHGRADGGGGARRGQAPRRLTANRFRSLAARQRGRTMRVRVNLAHGSSCAASASARAGSDRDSADEINAAGASDRSRPDRGERGPAALRRQAGTRLAREPFAPSRLQIR